MFGIRFSKLVVIGDCKSKKARKWVCTCDCGNTVELSTTQLKSGQTKSCGCLLRDKFNLIGKRFGELIVVSRLPNSETKTDKSPRWECLCDCGRHIETSSKSLSLGKRVNCGCKLKVQSRKVSRSDSQLNALYCSYKHTALKRGIDFYLSKLEFKELVEKSCYYCGSQPKPSIAKNKTFLIVNGVDRFDNNQAYIITNCVPCCKFCNTMKMGLEYDKFLENIKNIYEYRISSNK